MCASVLQWKWIGDEFIHVKLWWYIYVFHLSVSHSFYNTHAHSRTHPKVTSPVRIPSEKQVKRVNIYSVKPRLQLLWRRPGGEERGGGLGEPFRMSRDAMPPPDLFWSDCGAPQPPVRLTLVEITWQNQFNVITQPRASSCLGESRLSWYWRAACPSHRPPIYFSQMKMNYAFSSVTLTHKPGTRSAASITRQGRCLYGCTV